jgi:porphobilinogen deaminase
METSGDRGADPATDPAGSKGLFVAEIVRALRSGDVDLAVHSAKDLPAGGDEDLAIAAVPERASALDVRPRMGAAPGGGGDLGVGVRPRCSVGARTCC